MYFILFKLWAFKVFFKAFGFICFYLKNICCYGNHTHILIYPNYKINIYVQTRIFFSTYIFLYMKGTLPLDRCTCPASYRMNLTPWSIYLSSCFLFIIYLIWYIQDIIHQELWNSYISYQIGLLWVWCISFKGLYDPLVWSLNIGVRPIWHNWKSTCKQVLILLFRFYLK